MSNIIWDWEPEKFKPPFTILYGDGLAVDEDYEWRVDKKKPGTVSIMATAFEPILHQNNQWYVVSMQDVPEGQRRTTARALKLLVEQKWADHINNINQENQP